MAWVFLLLQMAQNMKENLKKIHFMEKENIQIQRALFLKENGEKVHIAQDFQDLVSAFQTHRTGFSCVSRMD